MNRAIRLSSLVLALQFALPIGYPQAAAGQHEKTAAERKAAEEQEKERERQKERERLKASGVDPKKLDGLRPGAEPPPKPSPLSRKRRNSLATDEPARKTSLNPEPTPLPTSRIKSKRIDDSLNALSSDHSQRPQSLDDQTPPGKDKDKAETAGSRHEGNEQHKSELHKNHSGCEALRTKAEVEACEKAKAASKKKN